MVRRVVIAIFILAVLLVGYPFAKDAVVEFYVDNYYVRDTPFPTSAEPDQIVLTWSGDPSTSVAVNWRTGPAVESGRVQYRAADQTEASETEAAYAIVEDSLLEKDPTAHRFSAILDNLQPKTTYLYRVQIASDKWTDWEPFTTAPSEPEPFSFVYLGDPQKGFDAWGDLVIASYEHANPQPAFYVIAGDLVNDGNWRNDWDEFFHYSASVFRYVPIVPTLGNHDVEDDGSADLYLDSMALPENGPESMEPERAYHFTYGNALFVVLDSTSAAAAQTGWLEEVLSDSTATWKFAVYHHPAYSSKPHRDNREIREHWGALFDQYGVDMALQGHDHAYLRTHPMRAGKQADAGTYYAVTVSGTKFYEQEQHDYAAVAFADTMTYQTIDIETNPDRLTYRAFNVQHEQLDELIIEK